MNDFDALLGELQTLAKAMPAGGGDADDKTIQDAANTGNPDADADGKNDVTGAATGADARGKANKDGATEDETFGKSFQVQLEDGSTVEAFDGTAMMKALWAENDVLKADVAKLTADRNASLAVATQSVEMIKSLQTTVGQLQADIARIGNTGAGRKAALTVHEKPAGTPLAKSEDIPSGEFMAKAEAAFTAGRLSGRDLSRAEAYIGRGLLPPADIVQAVTGA